MRKSKLSPKAQVQKVITIVAVSGLIFFFMTMMWHYFAFIFMVVAFAIHVGFEGVNCSKCGKLIELKASSSPYLPDECPYCGFSTYKVYDKGDVDKGVINELD